MSLLYDDVLQPVLELPADLALWQRCCQVTSEPAVRWRIYLHQLVLATLLPWFYEEFEQPVQPYPQREPWDIWQAVNGLALTLGDRRIVIIPDEAIDVSELRVPREWVDIPDWAADYYLAALVNVDQRELVLWGYTSHERLKADSTYDDRDRTYAVEDVALTENFSAFALAQQLEPPVAITLANLPTPAHAENLIPRLAQAPEPRLELPFEQWGGLLSHDRWRQQLWRLRQTRAQPDGDRAGRLRWVNEIFGQGWQSLTALLPMSSAFRLYSADETGEDHFKGQKIVLRAVEQLDLPPGNGQTASSTTPPATSDEFILGLDVAIEADNRRYIHIQLYPAYGELLPPDVTLALELPETGECLQRVQSGELDNFIQLPPFRCSTGRLLRVVVQLADKTFQEDFVS